MVTLFERSNALFSECGKHRIYLSRLWDDTKPTALFIGLNPSTANANTDDNTIKRVRKITESWGYGGFYMMNLFTYISTDPTKLNIANGNVVMANEYLLDISRKCNRIIFAWGNFDVFGRDDKVKEMFPNAYALHINKNGSPKHPLYCKSDTPAIKYCNHE